MSLGKNIKRLSFFGKDKDTPSTPLPFTPGIPQTPGIPSSADNDQPLSNDELHALVSALESLLTNFDTLRDLSLRLAKATKTQASSIEAYSKVLTNIPAGARNEGTNAVVAAMSASAAYLEEIGHVQSKFAKHMAKEYDALNTYAATHFRTLAKSEFRTSQTHLKLSRLAASQSGASPHYLAQINALHAESLTLTRAQRKADAVVAASMCRLAMGSYAMVSEGVQKCGGRIGRVNAWAPFLGKGDGSVWSVATGYPTACGEAGGGDYFGVTGPVSGSGTSTPGSAGTGMSTPGTPLVPMSPMYAPSTPSSLSVGAPLTRSRSPLNGTTSGTGTTRRRPINPHHPSYASTSTGTFSSTSGSSMPSPTCQHATPATSFAPTTSTRPSTSSASISIDDVDAEEDADDGPEVKGHARAPSTFALAKKTIATAPMTPTDSGTTSALKEDQTGVWAAGDKGAFEGMEEGNDDGVKSVGRRPQFGQYAAYGE